MFGILPSYVVNRSEIRYASVNNIRCCFFSFLFFSCCRSNPRARITSKNDQSVTQYIGLGTYWGNEDNKVALPIKISPYPCRFTKAMCPSLMVCVAKNLRFNYCSYKCITHTINLGTTIIHHSYIPSHKKMFPTYCILHFLPTQNNLD